MTANPYVVGQWVRGKKFYGRAALIDEMDSDESCTLTHLARRWKVSRRRIRRLVQSGALPFEQVSGQIRVPWDAIEQYEIDARLSLRR